MRSGRGSQGQKCLQRPEANHPDQGKIKNKAGLWVSGTKMFAETRGSVPGAKKNEKIGQATGLRDRNVHRDPRLSTQAKEK